MRIWPCLLLLGCVSCGSGNEGATGGQGGASTTARSSGSSTGGEQYFMAVTLDGTPLHLANTAAYPIAGGMGIDGWEGDVFVGFYLGTNQPSVGEYSCDSSQLAYVYAYAQTTELLAYDFLEEGGSCWLELTGTGDIFTGTFSAVLVSSGELVQLTAGTFRVPRLDAPPPMD